MPSIITRCLLQLAAVGAWQAIGTIYLVRKLSNLEASMASVGWKDAQSLFGIPSYKQIVAVTAIMLTALAIAAWGIFEREKWAPWPVLVPILLLVLSLANLFSWVCIVEIACLGNAFYELISDGDAITWLKRADRGNSSE